ncbi:hypothetical protein [Moraxella marmotae]|uniref:hypothetical protein n=1 Tax=Moraxella marmotae TaxID=3344520 RepID=UPI0035F412FD
MKKLNYQKVVDTTAVVTLGIASTAAFADGLDMSSATGQLTLALAAVAALGAAKMAPAALSWVWSLLTRVAQR